MKKIIYAFLCTFAVTATQAFAMDVAFDRDTQFVTISGNASMNEGLAVIVSDSEVSSLKNATADFVKEHSIGFYEANADENGEYTISFKSSDVDGKCNVFVSGETTQDNSQLTLYSEQTLTSTLLTFSSMASQGEAAILEALKNEELRNILGIDEIYNLVPNKSSIAFELAKKQEYISYASIETALLPVKCCTGFNAMINKVQVKELVEQMKEVYGGTEAVYTKYFGLRNTDNIDKIVFDKKPYNDIADVYSTFENAVKNYGSSQGGSGGSGGGGISLPATTIPKQDGSSLVQPPVQGSTQIFNDVDPDFWGCEAIENLYKMGIVSGVSSDKFAPNQSVKREEFVKMLVALTGLEATGKTDAFTDTDKSAWYSPYLAVAQECGIVYGKDNGSFGVGEELTRQDMAVLALRVLGTTERGTAVTFDDESEISDYAKDSIEILCGLKIMNGTGDGKFAPKATATRAQAAKVIYEISKIMK